MQNAGTSAPALRNTIIWGNSSSVAGSGTAVYNHSLVEGLNPVGVGNLNGTISYPAMFMDAQPPAAAPTTGGYYRQAKGTPVIDAGNSTYWTSALWTLIGGTSINNIIDLDGNLRLIGGGVDLGAYEDNEIHLKYYVKETNGNLNSSNLATEAWKGWDYACSDLQKVVDVAYRQATGSASIAEVWVAKGTYIPTEIKNNDGTIPSGATNRDRSEERHVGKECRSRWSPYH